MSSLLPPPLPSGFPRVSCAQIGYNGAHRLRFPFLTLTRILLSICLFWSAIPAAPDGAGGLAHLHGKHVAISAASPGAAGAKGDDKNQTLGCKRTCMPRVTTGRQQNPRVSVFSHRLESTDYMARDQSWCKCWLSRRVCLRAWAGVCGPARGVEHSDCNVPARDGQESVEHRTEGPRG